MARLTILMKSSKSSHSFTTKKNSKNTPAKIELKRYDPVVRQHVIYKEGKVK